jgi:hypothetical protein
MWLLGNCDILINRGDDDHIDDLHSSSEPSDTEEKMTWYQSWFRHEYKPYWFAGVLAVSIFFERFCFVVVVYKTREHGYVLILCVTFLNSMFALFTSFIKKNKHKRKLYEYFQLRKTPNVGVCIYGLISILDMFYVFFLFWPANVIPAANLITLLQLFIPLNMIIRRLFLSHEQYYIHWIAGATILLAWAISFVRVIVVPPKIEEVEQNPLKYCLFFSLSAVLEVISLGIKEGVVRSQPINNEKFNFKVSLGQFLIGIAITPIIVDIYTSSTHSHSTGSTWQNIGNYLVDGFKWVATFGIEAEDDETKGCKFYL